MNTEENPYFDKKIQKIINRLVSEEWLACNMYRFYEKALRCDDCEELKQLFATIAEDEYDDHYDSIVGWAEQYGYDVPCSMKDFQKYSGPKQYQLFMGVQKKDDPEYYIEKALQAEGEAVLSYKEALEDQSIQEFGDLYAILYRNYYDELEHLEKLGLMKFVDQITVG